MPIEQFTVPWLRMINAKAGFSLRTFGQSGINEPQFICFTNNCNTCGHISWWDLTADELEFILAHPSAEPGIAWTSNPEIIKNIIETLPEEHRNSLQLLLDNITPKAKNEPGKA